MNRALDDQLYFALKKECMPPYDPTIGGNQNKTKTKTKKKKETKTKFPILFLILPNCLSVH